MCGILLEDIDVHILNSAVWTTSMEVVHIIQCDVDKEGCECCWLQSPILSVNICARANEAACYLSTVLIETLHGGPYLSVVQPMTYYSA